MERSFGYFLNRDGKTEILKLPRLTTGVERCSKSFCQSNRRTTPIQASHDLEMNPPRPHLSGRSFRQ